VADNIKPTHLIIDEAAMATEPEAMIPIQLADHVTLIGTITGNGQSVGCHIA